MKYYKSKKPIYYYYSNVLELSSCDDFFISNDIMFIKHRLALINEWEEISKREFYNTKKSLIIN